MHVYLKMQFFTVPAEPHPEERLQNSPNLTDIAWDVEVEYGQVDVKRQNKNTF